jgi:hypothetical protein
MIELHHEIAGADHAPPLVLSNSLGSDLSMWDLQLEALAERFRVIRYDQRGHGRSPVPDGPYSIDDVGADALALMDRRGLSLAPRRDPRADARHRRRSGPGDAARARRAHRRGGGRRRMEVVSPGKHLANVERVEEVTALLLDHLEA